MFKLITASGIGVVVVEMVVVGRCRGEKNLLLVRESSDRSESRMRLES